jgi:carbonic anhydrase
MTNLTPFLHRNQAYADGGAYNGLTPMPKQQVFVITCMDGRVDPAHFLGVGPGEALVYRNAGGRVTEEAVREVAFIGAVTEMMLGDEAPTFEVAVIHHTDCGTAFLADDNFNRAFSETTGIAGNELEAEAVVDPYRTVAADVARLRSSALLPAHAVVSGHVYDVHTGLVETVSSV